MIATLPVKREIYDVKDLAGGEKNPVADWFRVYVEDLKDPEPRFLCCPDCYARERLREFILELLKKPRAKTQIKNAADAWSKFVDNMDEVLRAWGNEEDRGLGTTQTFLNYLTELLLQPSCEHHEDIDE